MSVRLSAEYPPDDLDTICRSVDHYRRQIHQLLTEMEFAHHGIDDEAFVHISKILELLQARAEEQLRDAEGYELIQPTYNLISWAFLSDHTGLMSGWCTCVTKSVADLLTMCREYYDKKDSYGIWKCSNNGMIDYFARDVVLTSTLTHLRVDCGHTINVFAGTAIDPSIKFQTMIRESNLESMMRDGTIQRYLTIALVNRGRGPPACFPSFHVREHY